MVRDEVKPKSFGAAKDRQRSARTCVCWRSCYSRHTRGKGPSLGLKVG